MTDLSRAIGWRFVSIMSKVFTGTPIQKWRLTSIIYARLVQAMYNSKDIRTTYKGVELLLPSKDPSIVPPIIRGHYESFELDVFRAVAVEAGGAILDVGGNIGLYAVIAGKASPKSKVASFEPVAENIKYLQKNVELNKLGNVEVVHSAVGAQSGELDIFLSETSIGHHSAAGQKRAGGKSVKVPMVSIDNYIKEKKLKPGLIKVDVEGYDFYVFEGAKKTMEEHQPTIFAEYGPDMMLKNGYDPEIFLDMLFKYSQKAYLIDEEAHTLRRIVRKELENKGSGFLGNILLTTNKRHQKILEQFVS